MQNVLKKIGLALAAFIVLAAIIVDFWYFLIKEFCPTKTAYSIYEGGTLEKDDGSKKNIFEIKYFTNQKKNGLECFELNITSFIDPTKKDTRSVGLQYVANSKDNSLDWYDFDRILDSYGSVLSVPGVADSIFKEENYLSFQDFGGKDKKFLWNGYYGAMYYALHVNNVTNSTYQYAAVNDQKYLSCDELNINLKENSEMLIQIGDETLGLKMKHDKYLTYDEAFKDEKITPLYSKVSSNLFRTDNVNFYYNYNFDFLSWYLFEAISTLPPGTNYYTFKFGDIFDYYDISSGNVWPKKHDVDYELIQEKILSYYTIKVDVLADGIRQAGESSFKVLHGSANYVIDDSLSTDYFAGRQIVNLDIYAFDLIEINEGVYVLSLKKDIYKAYIPKKNSILLSITIDKSILEKDGKTYGGFADNSGLEDFRVYSTKIVNGEEVT